MFDSLRPHESQHARPPCPSLRLASIESVMPSSHLVLGRPLLLPPIPPSIRVFPNESALRMRWPKYWSFSFSISPSKEHSRLIFRMDWLDLLAVQGTLKSLLQHHNSKASILHHSAFFTIQLLHPYMTTGKTIALTRWTFVGKIMSLLLNMLSRLVITFLPRRKRLLISWLQSPSAVILDVLLLMMLILMIYLSSIYQAFLCKVNYLSLSFSTLYKQVIKYSPQSNGRKLSPTSRRKKQKTICGRKLKPPR